MVNCNKLKGKIVEKGLNVDELADMINMDKSTFYRKLASNGNNFKIGEANNIVNALNLSANEATEIFFANVVA